MLILTSDSSSCSMCVCCFFISFFFATFYYLQQEYTKNCFQQYFHRNVELIANGNVQRRLSAIKFTRAQVYYCKHSSKMWFCSFFHFIYSRSGLRMLFQNKNYRIHMNTHTLQFYIKYTYIDRIIMLNPICKCVLYSIIINV